MSERNFSYICRIGDCERERLIARIAVLEGDADMVDEREMRSNLRIEALEAMLQTLLGDNRRVAASTDMTRSAMREGAAELANQIDAALKGGGNE